MSNGAGKRQALGRGLAALLPGAAAAPAPPPAATRRGAAGPAGRGAVMAPVAGPAGARGVERAAIEDLHPSPLQPRRRFDEAALLELAASMRAQGVLQPLVVRRRKPDGYEIIAGERRWRAAQRAGLREVPIVVRDVDDRAALELALVENLQRADLNPIEEAAGYERLQREFGHTQEALAAKVGKDRSTVANALRLLKLPAAVRELVGEGRLEMGHARALLGAETADAMLRLARKAVAEGLSVRQVEAAVRALRGDGGGQKATAKTPSASARDLGERLQRALGAKVRVIESTPKSGRLEIHYGSLDQLDGILAKLLPR